MSSVFQTLGSWQSRDTEAPACNYSIILTAGSSHTGWSLSVFLLLLYPLKNLKSLFPLFWSVRYVGEIHLYFICWFKFQLKELDVKGFDIFKASQTVSFDQPGNIFSKGTRFKLSVLQNCCYCYCFQCYCCFAALPVTTCALILCTFPYVAGRLKIQLAPSSVLHCFKQK